MEWECHDLLSQPAHLEPPGSCNWQSWLTSAAGSLRGVITVTLESSSNTRLSRIVWKFGQFFPRLAEKLIGRVNLFVCVCVGPNYTHTLYSNREQGASPGHQRCLKSQVHKYSWHSFIILAQCAASEILNETSNNRTKHIVATSVFWPGTARRVENHPLTLWSVDIRSTHRAARRPSNALCPVTCKCVGQTVINMN